MQRLVELCAALDRRRRTGEQLDALVRYFRDAPRADAAWTTHVLAGHFVVPPVSPMQLRGWVCEVLGLPRWLVAECQRPRRDPLEILALMLCGQRAAHFPIALDELVRLRIAPAVRGGANGAGAMRWVHEHLSGPQAYVTLALLSGTPPVRVVRALLLKALVAASSGAGRDARGRVECGGARPLATPPEARMAPPHASSLDPAAVAYRLDTGWSPERHGLAALCARRGATETTPNPARFPRLATVAEDDPRVAALRAADGVWQPDGIRAQLGKQHGVGWLWTATGRFAQRDFAELAAAAEWLPEGAILEGAIVQATRPGARRSHNRPTPGAGQMTLFSAEPVRFVAVDLLAPSCDADRERVQAGADAVHRFAARRRALAALLGAPGAPRCLQLAAGRNRCDRGSAGYPVRGARVACERRDAAEPDAWLVVPAPGRIRAVLMSARRGRRRSFSRLVVGVWCDQQLSPVGICRSALPGAEQEIVDHFIRESGQRHGPAAVVPPQIVCDVSFDAVVRSRRRVGLSLVRPNVVRIVHDAPAGSAADRGVLERMLER